MYIIIAVKMQKCTAGGVGWWGESLAQDRGSCEPLHLQAVPWVSECHGMI